MFGKDYDKFTHILVTWTNSRDTEWQLKHILSDLHFSELKK